MLETLERLRILFGARPLFLTLAVFALLVAAGRSTRTGAARWSVLATRAVAAAGVGALVLYAASLAWYALDPHFYDNAEPSVIAIGWLFHAGQPVYPAPAAAERYAHIYGPLAFMLHGYALGAFGPHLLVSKILSAAAAALSLVLTFAAARRHAPASRAIVFAGVCALLLMGFKNFSYWTRPEPFQLLAVSASLLLAIAGRGMGAAIGVGLASGLLWNLKITGPLYSLPVLVLLQQRAGWLACASAVGIGGITAALPFLIFANVSLTNYLYWFRASADTGLLLSTLKQNLEWALYFCLPLLLASVAAPREVRRTDRQWVGAVIGLGAGMAALTVAAAKPGAGPYHLMPFLPVIAYLVAWQWPSVSNGERIDPLVPRAAIAFASAAVVIAVLQQATFVATLNERRTRDESADIERFAAAQTGTIEMGYGSTEAASLARPILVFRNRAYLIDQPAVREHQLEGIAIPRATLDALSACRVRYWLVPKGEEPFTGRNVYAAVFFKPMFSDAFRAAFHAAYAKTAATEYYDVWECTRAR